MGHKLLLADDSLTIQKVVELVLVHEDFQIRAVNDGEQALELLESFGPDIVLADIEMPKVNGYQLCEKIKANVATANIPVVLLAGAFEPFDEEYAKTVGADDFIIKPFESQELISKVKSLLVSATPIEPPPVEQEIAMPETFDSSEKLADLPELAMEPAEVKEEPVEEEIDWATAFAETAKAEEPKVEPAVADEEYESKVALMSEGISFEEELKEASIKLDEKTEVPETFEPPTVPETFAPPAAPEEEAHIPSSGEVSNLVRESVEIRIAEAMSDVMPVLTSAMREAASKAVSGMAAGIIENVTREVMRDIMPSLRAEIHTAIGRIVPEIAETIIRKEIEKITSEL